MVSFSRAKKTSRGSPAGITGRNSITAVPGRSVKPCRGQNSPVLTATGRQGAPVAS